RQAPAISAEQPQTINQKNRKTIEPSDTFHQASIQREYNRRKLPPVAIGVLIAILVFIIIIVSNNFKNPEVDIEKTITSYFRAVESLDYQTVLKLYHPDSPYVENIQDFLSTPKDLNIDIRGFYDLEIAKD